MRDAKIQSQFFLGMVYDTLIKDAMVNEDVARLHNYLETHPEAGGRHSELLPDAPDGEPQSDYSFEREILRDSDATG